MQNSFKKKQIRLFLSIVAMAAIMALQTICHAQNPIIQTKYTADSDTAVHNAKGFSTQKTGNARNPIIWADFPDPAVIRIGDTYYMSNTTMHMCPGLPIMKSNDLVNWKMVGYAYQKLEDNDETTLQNGRNMYGKGSWASSLRYHNGMYYATTFALNTGKTYIFKTPDIESGKWEEISFKPLLYDGSLFFDDDDRVYKMCEAGDIRLVELDADLSGIKKGGFDQIIIKDASAIAGKDLIVTAEGAHLHKINGKYYLFLITWPRNGMRTQLVFRADKITGPYEGRIFLHDQGVAEGCLIDSPQGDWYAMLFQDNGAVGRTPFLVLVKWENGWPVADNNGKVPQTLNIPVTNTPVPSSVASDEFDKGISKLGLQWQWNHNPDNRNWSLMQRPGFLRITTGRVDNNFEQVRNMLTQKTFGPVCSGMVAVDVSNMKDGDVAGLAALQKQYGIVGVKMIGSAKSIIMISAESETPIELASVPLNQKTVYLKVECDFDKRTDKANFYYSLDGKSWSTIGKPLQMSYSLAHFVGYRFALFNYSTKIAGGFVDFDYFRVSDKADIGRPLTFCNPLDLPYRFTTKDSPYSRGVSCRESADATCFAADSIKPKSVEGSAKPYRVELARNWKLISSKDVQTEGAAISVTTYKDDKWYPIRRMPATVLQILQEDGVYPDLYVGKNLMEKVPQDLYKQDWWYRTSFKAPVSGFYTLEFPGINYRAEIWLNGYKIADNKEVAGMYVAHTFNVTPWIKQDSVNVIAVRVTPEQKVQNVSGVELADSWFDWINWKYLGYNAKPDDKGYGSITSFVPDRNAGIWKPVYLRMTGSVSVNHSLVNSELLLSDSIARLTVFTNLHNLSREPVSGILKGTISRKGKTNILIEQSINLSPNEEREVVFVPDNFKELVVKNPDLWWPYTMGTPNLYNLHFEFVQDHIITDSSHIRFGIRSITQHRDNNEKFPQMEGGNFYLKVNGRDFLVRGGNYTPDLLYRYDPEREADILRYVKDLGINFLRWESKISSEHIIDLADEQGIPLMFGWMCCNQWEKWDQWDDECHCVAPRSLQSQIQMLRHHASVVAWSNASDGIPPKKIIDEYNKILTDLHWQNAAVNTVSAFAKDSAGNRLWDGIRMEGPYCWRPPSYWFSGKYPATVGSTAEQGDNEQIPTLESLRKFIPEDKLWPINDTWYMHAGAWSNNCSLGDIQLALEKRYGASTNVEDFVRKAQLAHYENVRSQFESFAACGWNSHKMVVYWMLNSHWPSFYGNLIDYFMSPGGVYYGAKKGLRPLSVVFDSYATGDNTQAKIIVFNQTPNDIQGLRVRVRIYDLDGKVRDDRSVKDISIPFNGTNQAMVLPKYPESTPVFFVRCQLFDKNGKLVVDNTYWKSQKDDDVGPQKNDYYTSLQQEKWSDMTALNTMPVVKLEIEAQQKKVGEESQITIRLHNPSMHIAFFERVTISKEKDGNEILPIQYTDNYVTVFPGETVEIHGIVRNGAEAHWVKLEGYNTPSISVSVK